MLHQNTPVTPALPTPTYGVAAKRFGAGFAPDFSELPEPVKSRIVPSAATGSPTAKPIVESVAIVFALSRSSAAEPEHFWSGQSRSPFLPRAITPVMLPITTPAPPTPISTNASVLLRPLCSAWGGGRVSGVVSGGGGGGAATGATAAFGSGKSFRATVCLPPSASSTLVVAVR